MPLSRRQAVLLPALLSTTLLAQPVLRGPPKRLGVLSGDSADESQEFEQELRTAMGARGWAVGDTLLVEIVYAGGKPDRLPALAAELVRRRVDVILCGGGATTLAAARTTKTIPIVFRWIHYPVEQGLVESYARPGGNVTGPALFNGMELTTKRIDFLREVAPAATRLAWVWPEDLFDLESLNGARVDLRPRIAAAARSAGFEIQFHAARSAQDAELVFGAVAAGRPHVLAGSIYGPPEPITEFALRQGLPSAFPMLYFVQAGGLMSYGPLESEADTTTDRAAGYLDRILRGARAAELAVDQPSRYELALNLRTAKALGLKIPQQLLLRADAFVE